MIPPSKKQIQKSIKTLEGLRVQHKGNKEYEEAVTGIDPLSKLEVWEMAAKYLNQEPK